MIRVPTGRGVSRAELRKLSMRVSPRAAGRMADWHPTPHWLLADGFEKQMADRGVRLDPTGFVVRRSLGQDFAAGWTLAGATVGGWRVGIALVTSAEGRHPPTAYAGVQQAGGEKRGWVAVGQVTSRRRYTRAGDVLGGLGRLCDLTAQLMRPSGVMAFVEQADGCSLSVEAAAGRLALAESQPWRVLGPAGTGRVLMRFAAEPRQSKLTLAELVGFEVGRAAPHTQPDRLVAFGLLAGVLPADARKHAA